MATHEYTAARTCVEQITDLRMTLRYLGVPIRDKSFVFGDNKTVVDTASTPHGKLSKRHTALSYHRVREAVASGVIGFYHLSGEFNPSDIVSKHWAFQAVWHSTLRPILFWLNDPHDIDSEKDNDATSLQKTGSDNPA